MNSEIIWHEVTDRYESLPPTTVYFKLGSHYSYWTSEDVLIRTVYGNGMVYDVARYSEEGTWLGNLVNYNRDKVKAWAYIPKWEPKEKADG